MKKSFDAASELDGYEDLRPEDQKKIDKAWEDGHVADEDIPESAKKPAGEDGDEEEKPKKTKAPPKKKAKKADSDGDEDDADEPPKKKRAPPKKKAPAEKKEKAAPKKRVPKKKKVSTIILDSIGCYSFY